jgi:hypothetical protein
MSPLRGFMALLQLFSTIQTTLRVLKPTFDSHKQEKNILTQLNQHHFHLSENCFLISVTPEYFKVDDCSWIRNGKQPQNRFISVNFG